MQTMKLSQLIESLDVLEQHGPADCEIAALVYDSRRASPGALFAALPGEQTDGVRHVENAVQRGAAAVVCESPCICSPETVCIRVPDARAALAAMAAVFWGRPAEKLCPVGITGTNGKTTVSFMLREILRAAGRRPGLIGTVRYEIGERVLPAARTTPEAPDIQSMLAQMIRAGCDSAVMEVSSHALAQKRVGNMLFDTAVFTNLTQDHLDYHGSLEEYYKVKSRLFNQVGRFAVINADDPCGRRLLEEKKHLAGRIAFGFGGQADVRGTEARSSAKGSRMHVESPWGAADVSLKLIGRFNLYNALAAFAVAGALDIPVPTIAGALAGMEYVPGRLEPVCARRGKQIYIDYAHTDDALGNVLSALREITPGKLVAVFGCGGNRDTGKRRLMGNVASRLADYTVITNDNPRREIPEKIAADIAAGFDSQRKYEIVLDRQAAIARGIDLIGRKDSLLIAGKGHETYQEFDGAIVPFDDRDAVREAL